MSFWREVGTFPFKFKERRAQHRRGSVLSKSSGNFAYIPKIDRKLAQTDTPVAGAALSLAALGAVGEEPIIRAPSILSGVNST